MKHYRVNKLASRGGRIVAKKDILASDDRQAIETARQDEDCPVCDVVHNGETIGSIV